MAGMPAPPPPRRAGRALGTTAKPAARPGGGGEGGSKGPRNGALGRRPPAHRTSAPVGAHLKCEGNGVPTRCMVSRHGSPAYFRSFGKMEMERDKPVQDDTIFRIYSMTKPITSVALMMLYEEGRFQLNDPVSRFIPSWKGQRVWVEGDGEGMCPLR